LPISTQRYAISSNAASFLHCLSRTFHCHLPSPSCLWHKRPRVWLWYRPHALKERERLLRNRAPTHHSHTRVLQKSRYCTKYYARLTKADALQKLHGTRIISREGSLQVFFLL
jgi:hypothetical protein